MKTVINQFPKHYNNMYNFGTIKIEIQDDDNKVNIEEEKAIIKVDWPIDALDEFHHLNWIGAFKGLLKVMKKEGTVQETKCKLKDSPYCEYLFVWK